MLPMVDLMNHSFMPTARVARDVHGNVSVFATQDVAVGTELCFNYGDHDNSTMLLDYGFVVEDNPHDVHTIVYLEQLCDMASELAEVANVACQTWKLPYLLVHGAIGADVSFAVDISGSDDSGDRGGNESSNLLRRIDPRLVAVARVLCAPTEASVAGLGSFQNLCEAERRMPEDSWCVTGSEAPAYHG